MNLEYIIWATIETNRQYAPLYSTVMIIYAYSWKCKAIIAITISMFVDLATQ